MIERIIPDDSEVITGSRVLKHAVIPMIDVEQHIGYIEISLDGNNLALQLDYDTAHKIARAILDKLPIKFKEAL